MYYPSELEWGGRKNPQPPEIILRLEKELGKEKV
jgi:hypothetical protein